MLADEKLVAALQQDFGQEAALNFLRDLAVFDFSGNGSELRG